MEEPACTGGSHVVSDCKDVNWTTCQLIDRPENESFQLAVETDGPDEDGCFLMNPFRETQEYQEYQQFSLVIGLLTLAFGGLGLVGNSISILVLNSKDMRSNCFNNILTALNVTDSLHIAFAILDVLRTDFPDVYGSLFPHSFFPYFHYPALRICLCASIYLIMAVGVERYLAVCRPHHYREVQARSNRAALYISLALLGATAVCAPRFLEVQPVIYCYDFRNVTRDCDMATDCPLFDTRKYHKLTDLRKKEMYINFYHGAFWILVTGIVPFLILSVLNCSIYKAMKNLKRRLTAKPRIITKDAQGSGEDADDRNSAQRKRKGGSVSSQQQKKECNLATVLITTALTFLLLHLPRVLTSVYEALRREDQKRCEEKEKEFYPLWFLYSLVVMNILLVLNASSNFLIYLFAGNSFRDQFKRMLGLGPGPALPGPRFHLWGCLPRARALLRRGNRGVPNNGENMEISPITVTKTTLV